MKIGCPKEIKPQEFRVGMTPNATLMSKLDEIAVYYATLGPMAARNFLRTFCFDSTMLLYYNAEIVDDSPPKVALTMVLSEPVSEQNYQNMLRYAPDVCLTGDIPMGKYNVETMNAQLVVASGVTL